MSQGKGDPAISAEGLGVSVAVKGALLYPFSLLAPLTRGSFCVPTRDLHVSLSFQDPCPLWVGGFRTPKTPYLGPNC